MLSHKKMGPIDSAVLTFIGYKQTNRHTDTQAKYINRQTCSKKLANMMFCKIAVRCTLLMIKCCKPVFIDTAFQWNIQYIA